MSDVFSRSSALLRTREGEHSLRRLGEVVTMNEEVGEVTRLGLRSDMYASACQDILGSARYE